MDPGQQPTVTSRQESQQPPEFSSPTFRGAIWM